MGERERADAKLGRAGRALASGVKGWAGVESGSRGEGERKEVGPSGLGWGFPLLFLFPLSFFTLAQTNLFEFKQNLNSTTICTQANKNKCSSMMQQQNLTLDKILITCETKLD